MIAQNILPLLLFLREVGLDLAELVEIASSEEKAEEFLRAKGVLKTLVSWSKQRKFWVLLGRTLNSGIITEKT